MDSKKIEELLQKYWACETSLEEEQQLHAYFRQPNIPEHLKETASMFHYFDDNKKKSIHDVAFDRALMDNMAQRKGQGKVVRFLYNTMRIAAGVSVVAAAVWFVHTEISSTPDNTAANTDSTTVVDTYDDPKIAFEETKKALLMISKGFGTAEQQAKKLNLFNEAQQEIQKKDESKL